MSEDKELRAPVAWRTSEMDAMRLAIKQGQQLHEADERRIRELEVENARLMREGDIEFAHLREEKDCLRIALGKAEKALEHAEQLCTWLCEDSNRYPGTDPGNAARSARHQYREALAAIRGKK